MTVASDFQALKDKISEGEDDAAKAANGNKAACTRLRKTMQDVKSLATAVRESALEAGKATD